MYYYINILNVIHCQFMSAFFFENLTYCLHGPRRKVTDHLPRSAMDMDLGEERNGSTRRTWGI